MPSDEIRPIHLAATLLVLLVALGALLSAVIR
jgi:hypothetical protein